MREIKFRAWDNNYDQYHEEAHRLMIRLDGKIYNSEHSDAQCDRFVVNDSGIMRQMKSSNVLTYIKSKLIGAASSVLTENLTAERVVVVDSDLVFIRDFKNIDNNFLQIAINAHSGVTADLVINVNAGGQAV